MGGQASLVGAEVVGGGQIEPLHNGGGGNILPHPGQDAGLAEGFGGQALEIQLLPPALDDHLDAPGAESAGENGVDIGVEEHLRKSRLFQGSEGFFVAGKSLMENIRQGDGVGVALGGNQQNPGGLARASNLLPLQTGQVAHLQPGPVNQEEQNRVPPGDGLGQRLLRRAALPQKEGPQPLHLFGMGGPGNVHKLGGSGQLADHVGGIEIFFDQIIEKYPQGLDAPAPGIVAFIDLLNVAPIVSHRVGLEGGQTEGVLVLLQIAPKTSQIRAVILDGVGTASLPRQGTQKPLLQAIPFHPNSQYTPPGPSVARLKGVEMEPFFRYEKVCLCKPPIFSAKKPPFGA